MLSPDCLPVSSPRITIDFYIDIYTTLLLMLFPFSVKEYIPHGLQAHGDTQELQNSTRIFLISLSIDVLHFACGKFVLLRYGTNPINSSHLVTCDQHSEILVSSYFPLVKPDEGQPVNKGGQFCILGHGAVTKTIISGSLRTTITFKNTVHTPDLIANLVSISKLDATGCWALFG